MSTKAPSKRVAAGPSPPRSKRDLTVRDMDALRQSVVEAEKAMRGARMLSEASALLASSIDYETTLESLARLSTTAFADWCSVDLVNDDGTIRHLTVAHANPQLRDLVQQFQAAAFSEPDRSPGAPEALRLRKSVLLEDIGQAWRRVDQPVERITQLIDALGVRSLISVPLIVRDKILGTTTFSSSRTYHETDLHLAEELAQRAAFAIDTAILFREAATANRYKDQFLGTVAHELRTPLTSILGWVQVARMNPEMWGESLVRVEESANLMRVFIEDLLDITRIREQKLSMEVAEVNFSAIVRTAVEIITLNANATGIDVRVHLAMDPAPVDGDRVRLLQVVWNLLSNAVKFTPAGGQIDVRLEQDGRNARLTVSDNGLGISAELAPHVFELYRQAAGPESARPGLGIGLSIVAQIVRLHGGTVTVASEGPGHGSTFVVMLPGARRAPAQISLVPGEPHQASMDQS